MKSLDQDLVVHNGGLALSTGVVLIPFTLKMTSYVQPYFSMGIQFSRMRIVSSSNSEIMEELKERTTNTSAPVWSLGSMFIITKRFFANVQYRQSIFSSFDRNFGTWSIGLGLKFEK